jgi:hypothetical protein
MALRKTMPTRDEKAAVPENPHSRQYSAISGGYTNRESKPAPVTLERDKGR